MPSSLLKAPRAEADFMAASTSAFRLGPSSCWSRSSMSTGACMRRSLAACCTSRMPLSVFTPRRTSLSRRMLSTVRPRAMPRGRAGSAPSLAVAKLKPPLAATAATAPAPCSRVLRFIAAPPFWCSLALAWRSQSSGFSSGQQLLRAALRAFTFGFLQLLPAHRRATGILLHHSDASRHGTHQRAQIAAHALIFKNVRDVLQIDAMTQIAAWTILDAYTLVCAVLAGDITKVAANTLGFVDLGDNLVIKVKIAPILDARHRLANEFHRGTHAFLFQIILQTVNHVAHNTEPIMHGRGAHLDRARAQQHEFHGIAPIGDTTDTGYRDIYFWMLCDAGNHVQGNRLDRRAAISAVTSQPCD